MKIIKILPILMLAIVALSLSACSGKNDIVGKTWEWTEFQDTAGKNDVTVPNPENYTLTLNDDGTANIQADCNMVIWTYEHKDSSLTFSAEGVSTLMMCPEDSLDQLFLERLGNTVTYILDDGQLFLNLFVDAGNMVFDPQ